MVGAHLSPDVLIRNSLFKCSVLFDRLLEGNAWGGVLPESYDWLSQVSSMDSGVFLDSESVSSMQLHHFACARETLRQTEK